MYKREIRKTRAENEDRRKDGKQRVKNEEMFHLI